MDGLLDLLPLLLPRGRDDAADDRARDHGVQAPGRGETDRARLRRRVQPWPAPGSKTTGSALRLVLFHAFSNPDMLPRRDRSSSCLT